MLASPGCERNGIRNDDNCEQGERLLHTYLTSSSNRGFTNDKVKSGMPDNLVLHEISP